jgi:hypothetical protein
VEVRVLSTAPFQPIDLKIVAPHPSLGFLLEIAPGK